ncbi:hypothetical protein DNH61_21340 [Paenibacillus sambharensis]|uniref:Uncharacterized protein n=1 Tax=Paenibacillus sambharensis TaxID=1803190 RepID=A0A2W1L6K9_9BACL|nr:hypothetical protein [Paenibacillus sambharensis]PZD93750.1 hypothetical protein DNH61_21340 [Paenibacillus sambharensis]
MNTAYRIQAFFTLLAVLFALLNTYLLFAPVELYSSEWLPGFLAGLSGSIASYAGPFQQRKDSPWQLIITWVNFLFLTWYLLLLTPLAVLLFGP